MRHVTLCRRFAIAAAKLQQKNGIQPISSNIFFQPIITRQAEALVVPYYYHSMMIARTFLATRKSRALAAVLFLPYPTDRRLTCLLRNYRHCCLTASFQFFWSKMTNSTAKFFSRRRQAREFSPRRALRLWSGEERHCRQPRQRVPSRLPGQPLRHRHSMRRFRQ